MNKYVVIDRNGEEHIFIDSDDEEFIIHYGGRSVDGDDDREFKDVIRVSKHTFDIPGWPTVSEYYQPVSMTTMFNIEKF